MGNKDMNQGMDHKTLIEQTTGEIMRLICEKGYQVNQKLPNEYELGKSFGVSRNTVREALRALASNNILEIRQGAGTFISIKMGISDDPLGFSMIKDKNKLIKDLLQLRCIIEPPIAALAAQNANPEDIEKLETALLEVEEQIAQQANFARKDQQFHAQVAKCTGNTVASSLIPIICTGVALFSSAVDQQEFTQTLKSHRNIFNAIRDRNPVEAQQAMLFHLLYNVNRL